MNTFTIGQCLSFGWRTFKLRPWFFIGVSLALAVINGLVSIVSGFFDQSSGQPSLLSFLITLIFGIILSMGMTRFFLKAHDAPDAAKFSDLMPPWNKLVRFFAAYVLFCVIVMIGFVLLIVPGIIASLAFGLALYLVIDRDIKPIEALKESARLTKGSRWRLLGLGLVIGLINILGAIPFLIGLLVSIPVSMLAMVHAYRELSKQPLAAAAPVPAPAGTAF